MLTAAWATDFSRWFLAGYFTFVAVFYTVKILAVRWRTGHSPVSFGVHGTSAWRIYGLFRIFRALILIVCVGRVIWPGLDRWLVPIAPLWSGELMLIGDGLLLLSLTLVLSVHFYMAEDWRSGIDPGGGPRQLVTSGPYTVTRNPIAILIQLAQLGFFLALPTVFSLICLVIGVVALHRQVRLEEADMSIRHGRAYGQYSARVPRWLPIPGLSKPLAFWRSRDTAHARGAPPGQPEDPGPQRG